MGMNEADMNDLIDNPDALITLPEVGTQGIIPPSPDAGGLTQKQRDALPHLLAGRSIAEKCKNARISKASYFRWIRNSAFRLALESAREKITEQAMSQLTAASQEAVNTLLELMKDDNKWLKLRACETVLASVKSLREEKEIESKLVEIEKILVERKRFAR
jgi:hypothetical protein